MLFTVPGVGLDFQIFSPIPERREREAENSMIIMGFHRNKNFCHQSLTERIREKNSLRSELSFTARVLKISSRLPHETTAWRNVRMFSERRAGWKSEHSVVMTMMILLSFSFTHTGNRRRPLSTNLIICATLLVPVENGGIIELENKNWESWRGNWKNILLLVVALPASW